MAPHQRSRGLPARLFFGLAPALLLLTVATTFLFLGGRLWWDDAGHAWTGATAVPAPLRQILGLGPVQKKGPSFSRPDDSVHASPFSFDLAAAEHADWMRAAPDHWPLSRLAMPGTHDTLTHRIRHPGYRCQTDGLRAQLQAGVRFLDVRARVQRQAAEGEGEPGATLGIYHKYTYTGYDLADVAADVFAFLEAHPSEAVVMRLKEEGPPTERTVHAEPETIHSEPETVHAEPETVHAEPGTVHAGPGPDSTGSSHSDGSPFEAAFRHYRLRDHRTAAGFVRHLFRFEGDDHNGTTRPPTRVPTVGELRGKVLLLQEFPYYGNDNSDSVRYYGIPWPDWQQPSPLLRIEDDWQMADLSSLERKWRSIRESLKEAAAATSLPPSSSASPPLFLTHTSASVGVLPIDAAAGPPNGSVVGMNDRTGLWLEAGDDASDGYGAAHGNKTAPFSAIGIVIADFPGRRLLDAILARNNFSTAS